MPIGVNLEKDPQGFELDRASPKWSGKDHGFAVRLYGFHGLNSKMVKTRGLKFALLGAGLRIPFCLLGFSGWG
jgi:hypothetical protein